MSVSKLNRTSRRKAPAIAACVFEISLADDGSVQLLPAGRFRSNDGRPADAQSWLLNEEVAADVIARAAARVNAIVIDYEHQTLNAEENGQPAPAAGWFKDMEFRPGAGLFARNVEWTARAKQMIEADEYRYLSSVFAYRKVTGEVLEILHAGITNNPAIDGMAALTARAAAKFHLDASEEDAVNPELLALLGLAEDADEAAVIAALKALKKKAEDGVAAAKAKEDEIAALKTKHKEEVDPAKYVSVEVVDELRGEIAALRKTNTDREVEELVTGALEDGRLLPAQEKWARELGGSNIEALRKYVESAQPIAALNRRQTGGRQPEVATTTIDDDGVAILTGMGLSNEQIEAMKKEAQ